MKKTCNINLAGYPFIIDEDAYDLLKNYLDTIRNAFSGSGDENEIAEDIESRFAELLLEGGEEKSRIVTVTQISRVIDRIGHPEDILDEVSSKTDENESSQTPPPYFRFNSTINQPVFRKKLFRDPQNSMLGGVCSGIAHYFNIDPTIVRLLAVVLAFISGMIVALVYIVLWIVVPEARTPYQRMLMLGYEPTVENIGKTVTGSFSDLNDSIKADSRQKGFGNTLAHIFAVLAKIFCIIILCPIILALGIAFFVCIISFIAIGCGLFDSLGEMVFIDNDSSAIVTANTSVAIISLLWIMCVIITISIPVFLFIRMALRNRRSSSNMSKSMRIALLVIWLIGVTGTVLNTIKLAQIDNNKTLIEVSDSETGDNLLYIGFDETKYVNIEEEQPEP